MHGTREEMSEKKVGGRAPFPCSLIFCAPIWPNALTRRLRALVGLKELEMTATYKYYLHITIIILWLRWLSCRFTFKQKHDMLRGRFSNDDETLYLKFQSLSWRFPRAENVKCWWNSLEMNSGGSNPNLEGVRQFVVVCWHVLYNRSHKGTSRKEIYTKTAVLHLQSVIRNPQCGTQNPMFYWMTLHGVIKLQL